MTTARMIRIASLLILLPLWASAETVPPLSCSGSNPAWSLDIGTDTATFDFQRQSDMTIPHQTAAEGRDWPRAMTLISRNDTAIVIIDAERCGEADYTAQVLTQRGETPILLTGCCAAIP